MENKENIQMLFTESYKSVLSDKNVEHNARLLAMRFLGLVDEEMDQRDISKKELAKKVGTSASFITQLFRGDRKPSWNMLAKMQATLEMDFVITTQKKQQKLLETEIRDYHRKWVKTRQYTDKYKLETETASILSVVDNDYALAG